MPQMLHFGLQCLLDPPRMLEMDFMDTVIDGLRMRLKRSSRRGRERRMSMRMRINWKDVRMMRVIRDMKAVRLIVHRSLSSASNWA